jgi:hypothetical protein
MLHNIQNRLKFSLERLMLRGPQYRVLLIGALIGLISIVGGTLIHVFDPGFDGSFPDAIWWAFLRLSDPGYLGDDVGAFERTVSTILTVLGYVVFLGSLVAIMTQWLNARMRELQAGLTPIAQRDHVLIIGWTNRTPTIVSELLQSAGRVRRFLRDRGVRTLRIAVLADEVTEELSVELRDRLGSLWNERQVILRTGSALRIEHLARVNFLHASAVIMPAADFNNAGATQADTETIKTLLSMANHPQIGLGSELPLAVAEIFDSRKIPVARSAYGGGPIEILASDAIIGRLIAQNVRHPGLSHVYGELLAHGRGTEIYIRDCADLEGLPFRDAATAFPRAIVLGIVRTRGSSFEQLLNPPPDTVLRAGDQLALLAHAFEDTIPVAARQRTVSPPSPLAPLRSTPDSQLRVLVLGWSHKVPSLLREFDSYVDEEFAIDVVSSAPLATRRTALTRYDFKPARVVVRHIVTDYTTLSSLKRLDVATYDRIVLLGSDRLSSGAESDARTIVAYLLLRDVLPQQNGPHIIVELLDAANSALLNRLTGEVIISPLVLSHMLAQVALRRELRSVYDELFGPGGAELVFRPADEYGLVGEATFADVEAAAAQRGEIALGVRTLRHGAFTGEVSLLPDRDRRFDFSASHDIVTLTTASA